ncbi:MAG TPA: hypothetical protein VE242_09290 [Chthoniobacterales bacterium]|nr:hypothetical protein [Chthoniobacterales bacterium]
MRQKLLSVFSPVRRILELVLESVGRHPLAVIPLPSIWLLIRYQPFWKDVDVQTQLLTAAGSLNILHSPPIYCFLARLPFWLTDTLIHGIAAPIFGQQYPSLPAVWVLILFQHLALWAALRYLLFSVGCSDRSRGIAAILLASVASFYTFAHTAGSEAMTAISWITVFSAGLRILLRRATIQDWVIYSAALLLAIGSRKVNGILLIWLPIITILFCSPGLFTHKHWIELRPVLYTAALVCVINLGVAGIEKGLIVILCRQFSVIERPTDGATFSDRLGTLVAELSPAENSNFRAAALALTADPNVRLAIDAQFKFGSYHLGGEKAIGRALSEQGSSGEVLQAERDRIISEATRCLYRVAPPKLVFIIAKEFVRTWTPTSDYRVARSGPLATFRFANFLAEVPSQWGETPRLSIFQLENARPMLAAVDSDPFITHWQNVPILAWCLLFVAIGAARLKRGTLSRSLFLVALSFIAIGTAAQLATCILAYAQPRYTLPLLVSVFAAGCVLLFGPNPSRRDALATANRREEGELQPRIDANERELRKG